MLGPAEHPWLDPLWRRIALVGFCIFWTGVEFYYNNTTWAYIFGAITAYGAWAYLYAYKGSDAVRSQTNAEEADKSD